MTELQQTLYQMLKEIHGICVENKIKYTLHPMLALFLKNDRDIPAHYESRCVYMTPDDLCRFISVCGASLPQGRSLESVRSNPQYPFLYSARYINTGTLCLDVKDGPNYIDNGLFIRVEALRTYPASKVKKKLVSLLEQGWYANTYQASIDYTKKVVVSKVIVRCMMLVGRKRLGNMLFDLAMRAYQSKGKKVAVTWKNVNRFFPKTLFRPRLFVLPEEMPQDGELPGEETQDVLPGATVPFEDIRDEVVPSGETEDENALDEDAQDENAPDEDSQGENAPDEDSQGENTPDEDSQGEDEQDEDVPGEEVGDPWDTDALGARLDKALEPPVDPSQVECFYIPAGWKTFLQTVYGKRRYRRVLEREYAISLARIESTDMTEKDLLEKFPQMEDFYRQRKRLRPTKKRMSRLFNYRNYCWAMVNMAGDKYQLKNFYEENRSRVLNLNEAKKYKRLMALFAPYQKAQKKYADYGQTFSLDEELDAIYYETLRRNKNGKFARKMQSLLK